MVNGWNEDGKFFSQSYESRDVIDSAVLIGLNYLSCFLLFKARGRCTNTKLAPLVFFIAPNDPRFLSTVDRILRAPEKGGLTSTGLVFRYDTETAEDGMVLLLREFLMYHIHTNHS